ncbi:MAG: hypothetical protein BJ554DRAFT_23 [Olpidium bornovanus]|uniref:Uncharacterized protein n=1 Tax=Olpidium bornovanus TaxID=278681 RepID=A0A8H8DIF1_9FUNG|nr:MAG: hypothetical protein BJ554DRAFT_23 [Olpidium bornovanus]
MDTDDAGAAAAHAKPSSVVANGRTPEDRSAAGPVALAGPEGVALSATPGNGAATSPAPASGADPTDSAAAAAAQLAGARRQSQPRQRIHFPPPAPGVAASSAPAGVRPGAGLTLGAGSPGTAAAAFGVRHAPFGVPLAPNSAQTSPSPAVPLAGSASKLSAAPATTAVGRPAPQPPEIPPPAAVVHASALAAPGHHSPQPQPPGPCAPLPRVSPAGRKVRAPSLTQPTPPSLPLLSSPASRFAPREFYAACPILRGTRLFGRCGALCGAAGTAITLQRPRVEGDDTDASGVPALPSAVGSVHPSEAEQKQLVIKLNFELKQAKQRIERQASTLELTKAEFDKQVKAQQERFNVSLLKEFVSYSFGPLVFLY